jgi:hypothetical protein
VAIIAIFDQPGMTQAQYEQVSNKVNRDRGLVKTPSVRPQAPGYLMSGSRGRRAMRSPIWLRLISLVPPAIDRPRCMRTSMLLIRPSPSMNADSGPISWVMIAADSWPISERMSLVIAPSGPGPPPATARLALRRFSRPMAWWSAM